MAWFSIEGMQKQIYNWEVQTEVSEEDVRKLSSQLNNLPNSLVSILIRRGVDTFEKALNFFRPSLDHLYDPYLMKDMNKAVERIIDACGNGEKIRIYGDYDVDGVTSVSMFFSLLSKYYPNTDFYIPDRYEEGYGVSEKGVKDASEKGVGLIISLDCGIKANDKVKLAQTLGIDFIICDHHEPGEELPEATAILDPKRKDCSYPFDGLSGCGVGFKLLQALAPYLNFSDEDISSCLDLLVVSIAADIVPIVDENRTLAYFGMQKLNEDPRLGIKTLMQRSNKSGEFEISDIVFKIAPSINAAGRIQSATSAVEMLINDNIHETEQLVNEITVNNESRRELDKQITTEALLQLKNDPNSDISCTTVLYHPEWHKGVIGIVASRVMEDYYKPTIILTRSNGLITGSARSVKGFNIHNALDQCSDLLEQFGGHMYAAGLTLKEENLDKFKDKFEQVVNDSIHSEQLIKSCEVDAVISLNDITGQFYRVLRQFSPFGPGNMNPVFQSNDLVGKDFRIVGKDHLKLKVIDPKNPSREFEAIAFGMKKFEKDLGDGVLFNMIYTIEENHWNGRSTVQLNIKDIKL